MRVIKMRLVLITTLTSFLLIGLLTITWAAMSGGIKGKVTAQGMKSPEGTVVYIDTIAGKTFDPPAKHAVVDQKKLTFIPHIVPVLKGTTVDFLNSDPVGHNVYWPAVAGNKKMTNNLGTWPQGVKKSFTFTNLGDVPLLCNVHPEMSGYIVVVPTPYFAVADKEGNYEITDVPPGHYTLKTWNEEAKPITQAVDVTDTLTTVNLTVKR